MSKVSQCATRITKEIFFYWDTYKNPLAITLLSSKYEADIHRCFGADYNLSDVLEMLDKAGVIKIIRGKTLKRWAVPISAWQTDETRIKRYIRDHTKSRK